MDTAKARAHGAAATEWQDYYDGRPGIRKRILVMPEGKGPCNRQQRRKVFPVRAGRRYS